MKKQFAFKLNPKIHHLLKVQAAKENRTMSEVLEYLIMEYSQAKEEVKHKEKTKAMAESE